MIFLTSDCKFNRNFTDKRDDLIGQRVRQTGSGNKTDHTKCRRPRRAKGLAQRVVVRRLNVHNDQDANPNEGSKIQAL